MAFLGRKRTKKVYLYCSHWGGVGELARMLAAAPGGVLPPEMSRSYSLTHFQSLCEEYGADNLVWVLPGHWKGASPALPEDVSPETVKALTVSAARQLENETACIILDADEARVPELDAFIVRLYAKMEG